MKLLKSLLLASATGLVAVSGASAADLGVSKPSPVEFVKACYNPLWGTSGGFVIPGTQTCLRVGGQARFDVSLAQTFARNSSTTGFRGGGNIFLDAITPSEFGNVRTFVQYSQLFRTGDSRTGTGARRGQSIDVNPIGAANIGAGSDFQGSSGFIQFAGFTFGRTSSFFAALGGSNSIIGSTAAPFVGNVDTVAYTAVLGNGFLATIAVEDPTTRRNGLVGLSPVNGQLTTLINPITGAPTLVVPGGLATNVLAAPANLYSGSRIPNFIAALRLDQAFGSFEVSGLVNEVRSTQLTGNSFETSKFGFSVAGGLKLNVPQIAAGDNLTVQGIYSYGSINSVIGNPFGSSLLTQSIGGSPFIAVDGVVNPLTGSISLTRSYSIAASFQHFWTPTFSTSVSGSYADVDTGLSRSAAGDYRVYGVGVLNQYSPVRGLTFALDVVYLNVDGRHGRTADVNRGGAFSKGQDGNFQGRFRVVRDF